MQTIAFRQGLLVAWDDLLDEHGSVDLGTDPDSWTEVAATSDGEQEADLDDDDIPF